MKANLAIAAVLFLGSCMLMSHVHALVTEVNYAAVLNGANERPVPTNSSNAVGLGVFSFNNATKEFSWIVFHNVTNANAAHIHGPATTETAASVLFFLGENGTSPLIGSIVLNGTQDADLAGGLWYVNIHSPEFPTGEIRGQVVILNDTYVTLLNGTNSNPPINTTAIGVGIVAFNESAQTIDWLVFHNVSDATMAHIHSAPLNGSILVWLNHSDGSVTSPLVANDVSVANESKWSWDEFKAGKYYINVHSPTFPAGEIRGDILPFANVSNTNSTDDSTGPTAVGTSGSLHYCFSVGLLATFLGFAVFAN
jgi:hypothetical protein